MWPTFYAFAAYYAQEALSSWVVRGYVCASVSPFIHIHLYFTISVAYNYNNYIYNTTQRKEKHRQTFVRSNKHQTSQSLQDNRESWNKRLLPESYFMRNILDLSAISLSCILTGGILMKLITVNHFQVHMTLRRSLGQKSRSPSDGHIVNSIAPEALNGFETKLTQIFPIVEPQTS